MKLGSGQALGILLNGLFAFVVLRVISKEEFALYTLFSSIQLTIASFSDMGINGSVVSIGARYRDDEAKLAHIVRRVQMYRSRFFALGLLISLLLFSQLLGSRVISFWGLMTCLVVTSLTSWQSVHNTVGASVLYLRERFTIISVVGPGSSALRVFLLLVTWTVGWKGLIVLLLINMVAEVGVGIVYRSLKLFPGTPPIAEEAAREINAGIINYAKPLIVGSVMHYIQPTLVLWLLHYLGTLGDVANYGAVGRLGQVTGFATYLSTAMVMTRMAKASSRASARQLLLKLTGVQVVVVVGLLSMGLLFGDLVLMLLGANYSGLHSELNYFLASWALMHFSGFFFLALISLGISAYQAHINGLAIIAQVGFALLIRVSTAEHAFTMNIVYALMTLLGQLILVYLYILRPGGETPGVAVTTLPS